MIHLFPIEPIAERYSADWLRWWPRELQRLGVPHTIHMGTRLAQGIESGQFLDVYDTHHFKATQLVAFIDECRAGRVKDSDTVLLLDGWNPMVESIAYIRDALGLKLRLACCLHAGTWDRWDFLSQRGMGLWARWSENGWMRLYDDIFVATEFHRDLIADYMEAGRRAAVYKKIHVTGFPLYAGELAEHCTPWAQRERLVVFPHRLAPEKAPDQFDEIKRLYHDLHGDDGTKWVKTREVYTDKAAYHKLLGSARVSVSTAYQETWGIAMLESQACGAYPVVPARLSYTETMPNWARYKFHDQAVELIHAFLDRSECAPLQGFGRWEEAIARIVGVLQ